MADKGKDDKVYEAIEVAKATGKIKRGANEVTKALERGTAKLVVISKDIAPPEITMHIPMLAKEKNVPCVQVDSKEDLGSAAGINIPASAIAITEEGEAKKLVKEIAEEAGK